MTTLRIGLALAPIAMLIAEPAHAVPDDVAEMRDIIATQFAGNPNAYVEEERGDFRRMGCRNRTDLLQALLDDGLLLDDLSYETHFPAFFCAYFEDEHEAMRLLVTPDLITNYEFWQYEKQNLPLLKGAIRRDDYDDVRLLLENGVHDWDADESYRLLTREEHLLLAAFRAVDDRKEDAIRAFQDTGFGFLLNAARNEQNVRYVEERAGKSRGGGGLGGLLGAIGGAALGGQLGGVEGAAAGLLIGSGRAGGSDESESNRPASGPLALPTGRAKLGLVVNLTPQPQGGVLIHDILDDGPAQAAGLMAGDVITQIAGRPVNLRGSFYVALEQAVDLETFELRYRRDGSEQSIQFDPSARFEAAVEEEQATLGRDATGGQDGERDTDAMLAELERLADLHDRGILAEEEFEAMKARILGTETKASGGVSTPAESTPVPEAFGVRMGQPISSLSIIKDYPNGRYKVAPLVSVFDLESLIVRATPETGVCAVEMIGKSYENDRRGQAVLAAYNRHRQELDKLYGLPEETDVLRENSKANDAKDYAQSFWIGHRVRSSVWRINGPNGARSIYLDIRASGPFDLYVKVSHTFPNFDRCESITDAQSS